MTAAITARRPRTRGQAAVTWLDLRWYHSSQLGIHSTRWCSVNYHNVVHKVLRTCLMLPALQRERKRKAIESGSASSGYTLRWNLRWTVNKQRFGLPRTVKFSSYFTNSNKWRLNIQIQSVKETPYCHRNVVEIEKGDFPRKDHFRCGSRVFVRALRTSYSVVTKAKKIWATKLGLIENPGFPPAGSAPTSIYLKKSGRWEGDAVFWKCK